MNLEDIIISPDRFTEILLANEGKTVSVWTGNRSDQRHSFESSICVNGILERKKGDTPLGKLRIVNSEGTYVYFELYNVKAITQHKDVFKDGAKILVEINPMALPLHALGDLEESIDEETIRRSNVSDLRKHMNRTKV